MEAFHSEIISGKNVSFIKVNGVPFANLNLNVLGLDFPVSVKLKNDKEPWTMDTHVFGFDANFSDAQGHNVFYWCQSKKGGSGQQSATYNGSLNASVSFKVRADESPSSYEYNLKRWIPKIERALNKLFDANHQFGVAKKISQDKIAIIGLGGTGMRLAELLSKSPISKILLIDPEMIEDKNIFKLPINQDDIGKRKIDVASNKMSLSQNVVKHFGVYESGLEELHDINFAFICIDDNDARSIIKEDLISRGIDFIDSGIWIKESNTSGYRFASRSSTKEDMKQVIAEVGDYKENTQIAEINALAAAQAVIHYKTIKGFYKGKEATKSRIKIENGFSIKNEENN